MTQRRTIAAHFYLSPVSSNELTRTSKIEGVISKVSLIYTFVNQHMTRYFSSWVDLPF
jgi:hypothetical protein